MSNNDRDQEVLNRDLPPERKLTDKQRLELAAKERAAKLQDPDTIKYGNAAGLDIRQHNIFNDQQVFNQLHSTNAKAFWISDTWFVIFVFLLGCTFTFFLSSYKNRKQQQFDDILSQYQGDRGKYEKALEKTKWLFKIKYRVKIVEKVYYTFLVCLSFVFYKSPYALNLVFVQNGYLAITGFSLSIIFFQFAGWYLDNSHQKQEKAMKKLKMQQKDLKFKLLSQMDPLVVEAVKEIVRKDMKSEYEMMRNSDQGCSKKCRLMKVISDKEIDRSTKIVKAMLDFEWCDICSVAEPGAVSNGLCKKKCGQLLVQKCIPLMQEYGKAEAEIIALNKSLETLNLRVQQFHEYKKAKEQYNQLSEQEKALVDKNVNDKVYEQTIIEHERKKGQMIEEAAASAIEKKNQ